jgi:chromosome segregation ATPase
MSLRQRQHSIQQDYEQFATDSENWNETVTRFVTHEYTTVLEQISQYDTLTDEIQDSCKKEIDKLITETVSDLTRKSSYPKWEETKATIMTTIPLLLKDQINKWYQEKKQQLQLLQIERNTLQDKLIEKTSMVDTLQDTIERKTNEYDTLLCNHTILQQEYNKLTRDVSYIKQIIVQSSIELDKQSKQLQSVVTMPQRTLYCCKNKCIIS